MANPPERPIPSDESTTVSALGRGDITAAVVSMSARHPDGHDEAYLRWHGLDHLPEQYRLAGLRHGARWVSTPACRAVRLASAPRFDAVDHVVQYLFADPVDVGLDGFFSLGKALHDVGRMPIRLPPVEVGGYRFAARASSADALVGAAVLPWRPAEGIELLIEAGTSDEDVDALVDVDGVAGCWAFDGSDSLHPRLTPTDGLSMILLYLDDDPVAVTERLRGVLAERWRSPAVTPLLAAPLVSVAPFAWDAALP